MKRPSIIEAALALSRSWLSPSGPEREPTTQRSEEPDAHPTGNADEPDRPSNDQRLT